MLVAHLSGRAMSGGRGSVGGALPGGKPFDATLSFAGTTDQTADALALDSADLVLGPMKLHASARIEKLAAAPRPLTDAVTAYGPPALPLAVAVMLTWPLLSVVSAPVKVADGPLWAGAVKLTEVPLGGTINLGPFEVEMVTITHSIAEPNGLAIKTPLGTILHTGDWKLDNDPVVSMHCWGNNATGALGQGDYVSRFAPSRVDFASLCDAKSPRSYRSSISRQTLRPPLRCSPIRTGLEVMIEA